MPKIILLLTLFLAISFYVIPDSPPTLLYLHSHAIYFLFFIPAFLFSFVGINYRTAYLIIFKTDKTVGIEEVNQVLKVLQSFGVLTLLTGLMGMLVGLILMFQNLDTPEVIGPAMAVSLYSILYAMILRIFTLTVEYNLSSRHHLWDDFLKRQPGEWSVYIYGLFSLLSFFVLLFAMS
ncbi:MotA/TolQ/ExbB proton channel family protein [bacterium]|nr:MotA/TolQ/ExbB proton channel family protein [bacterium]